MHMRCTVILLAALLLWGVCVGVHSELVDVGGGNANSTEEAVLDDVENKRPSEVQKAVCTVIAGEVRASAEAVTTKTLKGVCGSVEMNAAFHDLEAKLYGQLAEIKGLLVALQQQQNPHLSAGGQQQTQQQQPEIPQSGQAHVLLQQSPSQEVTPSSTSTPFQMLKLQPISEKPKATAALKPKATEAQLTKPLSAPKLKSLPSAGSAKGPPLREREVNQFNNTLLSDRELKVFTYYWKLENFSEYTTKTGQSAVVESPIFSIKGKTLHITAQFQHLHREYLYLQLEYATLLKSNRNSIMLDTGDGFNAGGQLFKEIASDKMLFKHKISILDQQHQHGNDLVSQEFSNLESGFLIPNSALLTSPYVKDNSLLIQLFLYL